MGKCRRIARGHLRRNCNPDPFGGRLGVLGGTGAVRGSGGMNLRMKTTLNIDDSVMQRLREEAARRGTSMSALVEAGLRHVLAPEVVPANMTDDPPPLPSWRGGPELVDISDRDALYRAMEEEG